MREDSERSKQTLDSAGNTMKSSASKVVPAPMREDAFGFAQPLDLAWTTLMLSVANVVPAPRLELRSGSSLTTVYAVCHECPRDNPVYLSNECKSLRLDSDSGHSIAR